MTIDLVAIVTDRPLTDVLFAGFVDRADTAQFFVSTASVYLDFDGVLVRLQAEQDRYAIHVALADAVSRDVPMDAGDEFCVSALFTLLLGDVHAKRRVDALEVVTASDDDDAVLRCDLSFEGGDQLNIEPAVPDGIRVLNGARRADPERQLREPAPSIRWRREFS